MTIGRLLLALFGIVFPLNSLLADQASEKRVALVIGNGAYIDPASSLDHPANDARSIAAKFRSLGIEVIEAVDLDYRGMREALRRFDRALQTADAGIFYYAGHAMEYRRENYLLPTDAILETEGDIGLGLINMDQVLQVMETAVPTRLLFLDSCRNNPLANRLRRSSLAGNRSANVGSGLGRIDTAVGTFIAYATSPGAVAADGFGENSPFTAAMLTHLDEPGLDISRLMLRVRNSVIEATNHEQIPWDSSSLRRPFILNLQGPEDAAFAALPRTAHDDLQLEALFWESIRESETPADFEAYLSRFGDDGVFTPLARSRIEALKAGQQETAGLPPAGGRATASMAEQESRCLDGHSQDCAALGLAYYLGRGVEKASDEAARWHRLACRGGHSRSCTDLGYLHENGEGVEHDLDQAAAFYSQGCNGGSLVGCTNLGYLHESGQGVEKSPEKAANYYHLGCEGGYARGCTNLGYLYENGLGVDRNAAKAGALYRKSCDDGNAVACTNLGSLHEHGHGVDEDKRKAISLYHQGCDAGDASGCTDLGYLYERGLLVGKSPDQAASLYRRACDGGNVVGCTNLGFLYETGQGMEEDGRMAGVLYRRGCDGGHARACTNLGTLFESGQHGQRDGTEAAALYRQGCEGGNALGCANLAYLYEHGDGVERNREKALAFFEKACNSGLGQGCSGLASLKRTLQPN